MPISPYDGYTAGSNWIRANQPVVVTNVAALRALDKTKIGYAITKGYYTSGDGGAGEYWYDISDTTSTDNGGTVIVASDGGRWKRCLSQKDLCPEIFGAVADGISDDTTSLKSYISYVQTGGEVQLTPGKSYRITNSLTLTSKHLVCNGKATIIADLNNTSMDALVLNALEIRPGTQQIYTPGSHVRGVIILAKSALRDSIRINRGDYVTLRDVDTQRDPNLSPITRDGVHFEADADGHWIENLLLENVRVSDAGRDGFRFEIPANSWHNVFINNGTLTNCEVRGAGLVSPGKCINFVSHNTTVINTISQINIMGGEYSLTSSATNQNPDGIGVEKGIGCSSIGNITIIGTTIECVPTSGSGYAINTKDMDRSTFIDLIPYNFSGSSTGIGGGTDYVLIGSQGLDAYYPPKDWTPVVSGGTTPGTPVYSFRLGRATRIGKLCHVDFQFAIASWGDSVGNIQISGLPWNVSANAFNAAFGSIGLLNTLTMPAGFYTAALWGVPNTNTMTISLNGSGVNQQTATVSQASSSFSLYGSLTYVAD